MKREDYIWISIKVMGLFFIGYGFVTLSSIINISTMAILAGGNFTPVVEGLTEYNKILHNQIVDVYRGSLISSFIVFFLYNSLGLYLLMDGKLVFRLIRFPLTGSKEAPTNQLGNQQ